MQENQLKMKILDFHLLSLAQKLQPLHLQLSLYIQCQQRLLDQFLFEILLHHHHQTVQIHQNHHRQLPSIEQCLHQ